MEEETYSSKTRSKKVEEETMTTDFTRQMDILPPSAIIHPITMIGLGGIGSHVIYTIRKLGFEEFTLWDPDTIE